MTYGIVYGCPFSVERTILQRLSSFEGNPVHPLLIFGIIAEIELARHARIVDKNVNEVEAKIFELDSLPNLFQNLDRGEIMKRNKAKRSAWLDLTYLRNSLQTWHTQLRTMSDHVIELENCVLARHECLSKHACDTCAGRATTSRRSRLQPHAGAISSLPAALTIRKTHLEQISACCDVKSCPHCTGLQGKTRSKLIDLGSKIKRRLDTIQCEYEEKIRDCTMRVDGMAMATQWAHGETTVEMATATHKESNVMKSISLVTMIFLPGTFFATIFSMTFFDWKSDSSERVSSYLWIYIVVTVFFTTITIGLWYYFVIHRRNVRKVAEKC